MGRSNFGPLQLQQVDVVFYLGHARVLVETVLLLFVEFHNTLKLPFSSKASSSALAIPAWLAADLRLTAY
jgi:hypothetical protein